MPIYTYECPCGNSHEEVRKIDQRLLPTKCVCGDQMKLIISPVANSYISGYPYHDSVLDCEVSNPAHRKRLLKENGLIERG